MKLFSKIKIEKEFVFMIATSIVISIIFLFYQIAFGIPMTRAKNELNAGIKYFEDQKFSKAETKFKNSLQIWDTENARQWLSRTQKELYN